MTIRHFFVFIAACVSSCAFAQITIDVSDASSYWSVGKGAQTDSLGGPSVNVGTASASSQTFDFSGLTATQLTQETMVDPASTAFASKFAGSTVADKNVSGGMTTFAFFQVKADGVYALGLGSDFGTATYSPSEKIVALPMTIGTQWGFTSNETFTFGTSSFQSTIHDIALCDAFGTLVTARGSFPCLRVRTQETTIDGFTHQASTTFHYDFLTKGGEQVRITVDSGNDAQPTITQPNSIDYLHPAGPAAVGTRGPLENPAFISAYPNPAAGNSSLHYVVPFRGVVQVDLVNTLGSVVRTLTRGIESSGPHSIDMDTRHLPAGTYECRLAVNGTVSRYPIVVVK